MIDTGSVPNASSLENIFNSDISKLRGDRFGRSKSREVDKGFLKKRHGNRKISVFPCLSPTETQKITKIHGNGIPHSPDYDGVEQKSQYSI